jgi:hypothetical protein
LLKLIAVVEALIILQFVFTGLVDPVFNEYGVIFCENGRLVFALICRYCDAPRLEPLRFPRKKKRPRWNDTAAKKTSKSEVEKGHLPENGLALMPSHGRGEKKTLSSR